MSNRARDWRQAEADLRHARNALRDGDHDWACFAAHQSAEKAAKAVHEGLGQEAWGHVVTELLDALRAREPEIDDTLLDRARALDKLYVPTRYPNGLAAGAPTDFRLFGSLARGDAGPGSDADLFVVVHDGTPGGLDRGAHLAREFGGVGIGCDVIAYTESEARVLAERGGPFARAVLEDGLRLAWRSRGRRGRPGRSRLAGRPVRPRTGRGGGRAGGGRSQPPPRPRPG
jgi:HEPN domain-containing protein